VKLTYTLTLADFKAGIRLHKRQKLGRRIHFFVYDVLIPLLGALALLSMITAYLSGEKELLDDVHLTFATIVAIAVLTIAIRALRVRKAYKELFPPGRLDRNWSMEIDDEGILYSIRGVVEGRVLWSGILSVAQDDRIISIYISEIQYLSIPSPAMSSEQRAELNDLVARHVVKKKP